LGSELSDVAIELIGRDNASIFAALVGREGGEVFLDVPRVNAEAVALAVATGFAPVFETARMNSGPIRPVAWSGFSG
jgi:hypothetical protein